MGQGNLTLAVGFQDTAGTCPHSGRNCTTRKKGTSAEQNTKEQKSKEQKTCEFLSQRPCAFLARIHGPVSTRCRDLERILAVLPRSAKNTRLVRLCVVQIRATRFPAHPTDVVDGAHVQHWHGAKVRDAHVLLLVGKCQRIQRAPVAGVGVKQLDHTRPPADRKRQHTRQRQTYCCFSPFQSKRLQQGARGDQRTST